MQLQKKTKMANPKFSSSWKRSTQARKQHLYRYNAPLHIKQKLVHVHLSPELRKKYGLRNIQLKKGDKVKILRGQFAGKDGKVEKISLKREKVLVTGIELIKKDGTKLPFLLQASNLMITDLDLNDKKRKQKLESKNKQANAGNKPASAEKTAEKNSSIKKTKAKTEDKK